MTSEKHLRALQAILDRASADQSFRRRLLIDPRAAILETFGVAIPLNFRIKFIERDPSLDALVVLPDLEAPSGELTDQDLERVAGGVSESAEWAEDVDADGDNDQGWEAS